jgi:hypothetical protein
MPLKLPIWASTGLILGSTLVAVGYQAGWWRLEAVGFVVTGVVLAGWVLRRVDLRLRHREDDYAVDDWRAALSAAVPWPWLAALVVVALVVYGSRALK